MGFYLIYNKNGGFMEFSRKNSKNGIFCSAKDTELEVSWSFFIGLNGTIKKNNGVEYDYQVFCNEFYEVFGESLPALLRQN
jgi:hypothetical protein